MSDNINPFELFDGNKENKPPKDEKRISTKGVQEKIRQSINWIAVGFLCLVEAIFGLIIIKDDGSVGIKPLPTTALGWVLYGITILIPPIIAVLIFFALRQEGIKQGHAIPEVKEARDEWLKLVQKDKEVKPRSLKEYIAQTTAKEAVSKLIFAFTLSFVTTNIALGFNVAGLFGLVLQLFTAIGMGLMKMYQAIEYCTDELVIWYKKEAERVKSENTEKENESGTNFPNPIDNLNTLTVQDCEKDKTKIE